MADASCTEAENKSVVPSDLDKTFERIVTSFCDASSNDSKIKVTSGTRSPSDQAKLMMKCLESGSGCPSYQNQEAYKEIKAAYASNKAKATVTAKIQEQVGRGCFISKHLSNYALDLGRSVNDGAAKSEAACKKSLIASDKKLSEVLEADASVDNVVYFEGGRCDHFHVNFVRPTDTGYTNCPE